ncbi:MAG: gliding motility protein [Desulfobacteraceae bacterium IS3]|nr:MAG: gliding motility protein [Desulfobacteraceae bacterium IS3]HAO22721.1 gliding motility protein [Desulfobacteraceae bacterium]
MAFVSRKDNFVQIKIVYYGPAMSGKTSNLEYIYKKFPGRIRSDMVSIRTHGDRTIFFDFAPFEVGSVLGFDVRAQLYTVPGQVRYNATRKLVLKGVDGVVFVADSRVARREKNFSALKNLHENLKDEKKSIFEIPLVLQYNKRDITDVPLMPTELMEKELNSRLKVPSFGASVVTGENIIPSLKKIIAETIVSLQKALKE